MITQAAWDLVRPSLQNGANIMTYFNPKNAVSFPLCPPSDYLCRIWIVFSSGNKSRVYLGLIFSKETLQRVVKALIHRLGFMEKNETTFRFPYGYNPMK